jgi:hypothetical protein
MSVSGRRGDLINNIRNPGLSITRVAVGGQNAELFTPVWLEADLPRLEPADICVPVRERASALPFIREPCILETARPGEIEELRALLDRGGEMPSSRKVPRKFRTSGTGRASVRPRRNVTKW